MMPDIAGFIAGLALCFLGLTVTSLASLAIIMGCKMIWGSFQ
jgi:hypothetical protein